MQWAAGERIEALNLFERGFILSPTVADVVTAYHSAVAETGSFARAEPVFRDARALHPTDKRIAFFLIAMLIQQEKHNLAMREIEHAMIQFGIDDGILNAALQIRAKTGPLEIRPDSTRKSLSICMIVKNEELNLAKCLMSVKPVADEIIVVDTGSTDKTKAIASALGAKVFDFTWTHDFSEARNYSLSKASGGWILVLDADEIVSPLDHDKLKKLIKNKAEKRVAYTMVTRNYTNQTGARGWTANEGKYIHEEAGRGWIPSPKVRLFINDKRINFVDPVHELVEPALEKLEIKIKTCDVPIQHYGRLNQGNVIAKGKEYYRLGITKIEKTKGDYNAFKELAIQASEIGEYEEAVNVWQKVIELKSSDAVAFMNMGFAFLMMKQYDKAVEHSRKALDLDPDLREAALNYSAAELIAGDVKKAIATLESILKKHLDYPPAMGRLAAAFMIDGRKEEGLRYLDRLITKGFDCSGMLEEQARAFLSEGKIEQAVVLLQAALEKGMSNGSIHALLAECQQKMKCSTPASGAIESLCILPVQGTGLENLKA
jgi:Flp pilus assembly protein TadD